MPVAPSSPRDPCSIKVSATQAAGGTADADTALKRPAPAASQMIDVVDAMIPPAI
jgi:hypothetical protein